MNEGLVFRRLLPPEGVPQANQFVGKLGLKSLIGPSRHLFSVVHPTVSEELK